MNIRRSLYFLYAALGLLIITFGLAPALSCSPAVQSGSVTVPANTCPAVTGERGEDITMVTGSDIKRERPLIDVNAPVDIETATFSLG